MEQISLRIEIDLLNKIKTIAKSQSRSMASVMREAIIQYLEQRSN